MAEIALTAGWVALVDDADLSLVIGRKWYVQRIPNSNLRYARCAGPYRNDTMMHRLISGAATGQHVDHANGNGLDNRRANLRVCADAQNVANRPKQQNSGQPYKGVRLLGDKFRAKPWRACIGKEQKYLGLFASAKEAAHAYDAAAIARYGEFARLNFPN